jgi:hypothetical protein
LPEDIKEISDISISLRWTDSIGDNVVITTGKTYRPSDDVVFGRTRRGLSPRTISDYFKETMLFVYHFTIKNDSATCYGRQADRACHAR